MGTMGLEFRSKCTARGRELETIFVETVVGTQSISFATLVSWHTGRKLKEIFVGSTRLSAVHGL